MYSGKFGLEREAIRVDKKGYISKIAHPECFNESNPFITRDFAEAQIEMVTQPCDSIDQAVSSLRDIYSVVTNNIGDEVLWNQSNPPMIETGYKIPVAQFKEDKSKREYREYLLERYGQERSIISGVHFNLSFDNEYLKELHTDSTISFASFKNDLYLKIMKYVLRDRWFFLYLTNASPVFHKSFSKESLDSTQKNYQVEGMKSIRNSSLGYRNVTDIILDYSSVENYENSVSKLIDEGVIISESELYVPMRMKMDEDNNISYLELRFLDIYPFDFSGVNPIDLKYIHMYMVSKLEAPDFDFDEAAQRHGQDLQNIMSHHNGVDDYKNDMQRIHKDIVEFTKHHLSPYDTKAIFEDIEARIASEDNSYANLCMKAYDKSSYVEYHLKAAEAYKTIVTSRPFVFESYPTLELSTKILLQEAIKQGFNYEVLDSVGNFVELVDPITKQKQLIKQATKTNLDRYASILAMEDKSLSKKLLWRVGIGVPVGDVLESMPEVERYVGKSIVIKPNSTNFGEGITIFPDGAKADDISKAFDFAFSKDKVVLVEPFIKGKEYRFLGIDNEIVGVLHRRSANVIGDGIHTIAQLVDLKNTHPYRGSNYTTPLEYIKLDRLELDFLKNQGYTKDAIIENETIVYLRENSNISTGGDSVDVTDEVHPSYKEIALKSMKALDVKISGIDIIIEDITVEATNSNYSVLEMNFNPAIHIHTYPLIGKNRKPAEVLLKALFKER